MAWKRARNERRGREKRGDGKNQSARSFASMGRKFVTRVLEEEGREDIRSGRIYGWSSGERKELGESGRPKYFGGSRCRIRCSKRVAASTEQLPSLDAAERSSGSTDIPNERDNDAQVFERKVSGGRESRRIRGRRENSKESRGLWGDLSTLPLSR